ncbi:MAG: glutamyl-tRNA reductase [Deltaproteobacteria bacterium]|nr:glutamyl-tRNA reductase [Deltaproteobacteria bacterium]
MNLVIIGLNHDTSPVEIREKLAFPPEGLSEALKKLLCSYCASEAVILSTCNRVEVTAIVPQVEKGVWEAKRYLSDYHNIPLEKLEEHLYVKTGEDAVAHLFRVSAGLDSMVMGEPQILGQVKDAYGLAVHHNAAGIIVNKLYHKAFYVAKRIRTETRIGSSAVSISFAAVELAKKIFGALSGKSAMLIGAGEMAELAARHLISAGIQNIMIANRTYEKAVDMAKIFRGVPLMLREFPHYLKDVDIVIASTAATHFIIRPDDIHPVMKERRHRPMFFIDISVPRNIDPLVNNIDNAYVYDIDDLHGVVAANLKERAKEAEAAEAIIKEEVINFYRWIKSLDVVPTIVALKKSFEEMRKNEMKKALAGLRDLSEDEKKALDAMTSSIVKKILHGPIMHLKKEANNVDGDFYIEAVRRLFDIGAEGDDIEKAKTSDG